MISLFALIRIVALPISTIWMLTWSSGADEDCPSIKKANTTYRFFGLNLTVVFFTFSNRDTIFSVVVIGSIFAKTKLVSTEASSIVATPLPYSLMAAI